MARKKTKKSNRLHGLATRQRKRFWRILRRLLLAVVVILFAAALIYRFVDPPTTYFIFTEEKRLGGVQREWVDIEDVAPIVPRAIVAAEDANFCLHWGFDMQAIRSAVEAGAERGASTITQQVVKNVYLWPARRWDRKALEALITPFVEVAWPKRRVIEVYLNIAEFGEGVFGIQAAAQVYFGVTAANLTSEQAALLAAVLPNPKARSVKNVTPFLSERAKSILDGAATIQSDGRSACFED